MRLELIAELPITTDDEMSARAKLAFAAPKGKQKPEHLVGGSKDVLEASFAHGAFEQAGLTATLEQTSEEAVEVNAAF